VPTKPSAAPTAGLTAPQVGPRLDALQRSGLLDSPAEEVFDAITRAVAKLLDVPVALMTLVDSNRIFFKSIHGLGEPWVTKREAPLTHSLCPHVVKAGELVAVADFARDIDPRYHPGLLALGGAAYIGAPVRTAEGHVLGALCGIDVKPSLFGPEQIRALTALASVAVAQIESRRDTGPLVKEEGSLRDSEQLHRMLIEQACDAVFLADSAGALLAVNAAACELLGFERDLLLARKMTNLDPDEPNPPPPLRFDVLKAGKKMLRTERRMQRADGTIIFVEVSARVVEDGRMLVIAHDVSERKQAEEGVRRSEKRLRSAMAAARMSEWEWDIGKGTVEMSLAAQSLHGISDGAFETYQTSIHPDDRAQVFRALKQAVEEGGPFRVDYRVLRPDGAVRHVMIRAGAITDEVGDTVRVIGIVGEKQTED
jgi:PAS domain S-box-containing protein